MDKEKDENMEKEAARSRFGYMSGSPAGENKLENQNQTHNSRREGMGPNTRRKPG